MTRLILAVLVTALLAGGAQAQPSPPAAPAPPNFAAVQIKATDLGHRTWMLEGQGGNITVVAGDDGVILVDSQFAPLHDKIKVAVAGLSSQPIRYLVNTHLHGDHTGGNQAFWLDGATLVGHANQRRSMAEGTTNALTGNKTPPAPRAALPGRTYTSGLTLSVRGRRAKLAHMPAAHTRGDTAVWVSDANVLATGDIVSWGALSEHRRRRRRRHRRHDRRRGRLPAARRRRNEDRTGPWRLDEPRRPREVPDPAPRRPRRRGQAQGGRHERGRDRRRQAPGRRAELPRAGATDQQSVNFVRLIYRSVGG